MDGRFGLLGPIKVLSLPIVRSLHDVEVMELSSLAAVETATGVRGNSDRRGVPQHCTSPLLVSAPT